jgi:hypothetical protein
MPVKDCPLLPALKRIGMSKEEFMKLNPGTSVAVCHDPLPRTSIRILYPRGLRGAPATTSRFRAKNPLTGSVISGKRSLPRAVAPREMIRRERGHSPIPPLPYTGCR